MGGFLLEALTLVLRDKGEKDVEQHTSTKRSVYILIDCLNLCSPSKWHHTYTHFYMFPHRTMELKEKLNKFRY